MIFKFPTFWLTSTYFDSFAFLRKCWAPNPLDYTVIIFPTKINHLQIFTSFWHAITTFSDTPHDFPSVFVGLKHLTSSQLPADAMAAMVKSPSLVRRTRSNRSIDTRSTKSSDSSSPVSSGCQKKLVHWLVGDEFTRFLSFNQDDLASSSSYLARLNHCLWEKMIPK